MGRFRILERIGAGGMGTVYRAFDERLQRQVAVKEVETPDPARMLREAQAAARLNHPGVVTLYELGEADGRAVLVSELVPGRTLAALRGSGELCDRDVAEIGADLCEALAHAHERGVVHRDLKPQNVIVRDEASAGRRAKLMDFGIARVAGAPTLTADGEVIGTLSYMSPEQAEGDLAGPPSDVYSLALTLYECWAGRNPVAGPSPATTVRRIGAGVAPLRLARPDLPEGLTDSIDACLDPDPDARPAPYELGECLESELDRLDAVHRLGGTDPDPDSAEAAPRGLSGARLAALVGIGIALIVLAGPAGAPGTALLLAALCLPGILIGAPAAALVPCVAPPLAAVGLGSAAAALGAAGPSALGRAILGLSSWTMLLAASLALGTGPDLGIAAPAPAGWSADPGVAADSILAPMLTLDSLLGAAVFALAAVSLGQILALRHGAVALLGAMVWAAAVDAALSLVGDGDLGGHPLGVVLAAGLAVAAEFALRHGHARTRDELSGAAARRGRLAGRLA